MSLLLRRKKTLLSILYQNALIHSTMCMLSYFIDIYIDLDQNNKVKNNIDKDEI